MKKRNVRALSAFMALIMLAAVLSLPAGAAKDSCPHENRKLLEEILPESTLLDDEYHWTVISRIYRCLDCGADVIDVLSEFKEKHEYSLVSVLSNHHDKSHPQHYYEEFRRCACGKEKIFFTKRFCSGPPCPVTLP